MSVRGRFRRWRYRRQFIRLGWPPERAAPMAVIAAALNVPPKLVISGPLSPRVNHWSYWSTATRNNATRIALGLPVEPGSDEDEGQP